MLKALFPVWKEEFIPYYIGILVVTAAGAAGLATLIRRSSHRQGRRAVFLFLFGTALGLLFAWAVSEAVRAMLPGDGVPVFHLVLPILAAAVAGFLLPLLYGGTGLGPRDERTRSDIDSPRLL